MRARHRGRNGDSGRTFDLRRRRPGRRGSETQGILVITLGVEKSNMNENDEDRDGADHDGEFCDGVVLNMESGFSNPPFISIRAA